MGVRARVTLAYALLMAIVLSGVSVFLLTRLRGQLWDAVDDGMRPRGDVLVADVVEDAAQLGTREGVIDEAEVIAQVLDTRGRVVESSPAINDEPLLDRSQIARVTGDPRTFEGVARVRDREEPARILAARTPNGYIAVVGTSVADAHEALGALVRLLTVSGPSVLVLTSALVWLLTGQALRPVERLRAEAETLSFGIDGRRLAVPRTGDEIERLAATLNDMLERLERSLDRERRFVDDASHELRTPLAVLKTELELALRKSRTAEELEAAVRSAAEEVDDLSRLAEHLLILARADRGLLSVHRARTDVRELADQVLDASKARANARAVAIETGEGKPVWAEVDPMLVRQALVNLVENALSQARPGDRLAVDVSATDRGAEVVVRDTGPGFDPGLLDTVFEPFTQADGARGRSSGTGLGLAIVRAIAEAHGGSAHAENDADAGARVILRLGEPGMRTG